MKKVIIALLAVMVLACCSYGKSLPKGTHELDVQGSFDGNTAAGTYLWFGLGYGYFPIDNLEIAVAGAVLNTDFTSLYSPALGVQYNFDLGRNNNFVPFVGANIGWGFLYNHGGTVENGFIYGIEGGLKYFIVENLALNFSLDYDLATGNLFDDASGQMIKNNLAANWGLRYFF